MPQINRGVVSQQEPWVKDRKTQQQWQRRTAKIYCLLIPKQNFYFQNKIPVICPPQINTYFCNVFLLCFSFPLTLKKMPLFNNTFNIFFFYMACRSVLNQIPRGLIVHSCLTEHSLQISNSTTDTPEVKASSSTHITQSVLRKQVPTDDFLCAGIVRLLFLTPKLRGDLQWGVGGVKGPVSFHTSLQT